MDAESSRDTSGLAPHYQGALILANRLPFPLDDGWKVRTFHIARAIAATMPVTLIVFGPAREEDPAVREAERMLGSNARIIMVPAPRPYTMARLLLGLFSRSPVHVWNQQSRSARRRVQEIAREIRPGLAVASTTFVYPHLRDLGIPVVVDTHNVDSLIFRRYAQTLRGPKRWYAALTARKMAHHEGITFRTAEQVWVCSEDDAELVRQSAPGAHVHVVPNGVDTDVLAPGTEEPDPDSLLFFGKLSYYPNSDGIRWFAERVFDAIRIARSNVVCRVVGADADSVVRQAVSSQPGMRLVGRVDDVREEIRRAAVVIVPLRSGGGTRLKILEALSMAKPVVSTTVGAEGLGLRHGHDLMIADDPAAFATSVLHLLGDPGFARTLGMQGRSTVRESYDWGAIGRGVADHLGQLIS